jgi:hypothetical protein
MFICKHYCTFATDTRLGIRSHHSDAKQRTTRSPLHCTVQNISATSAHSAHSYWLNHWQVGSPHSRNSRSLWCSPQCIRFLFASVYGAVVGHPRCRRCCAHCYVLRCGDSCGTAHGTLRWPCRFSLCNPEWRSRRCCSWGYASCALRTSASWWPIWSS